MRVTRHLLAAASFSLAFLAAPLALSQEPSDVAQIRIDEAAMTYREAGEFLSGQTPVNAPLVEIRPERPFFIMQRQVRRGEYEACVAAGACKTLDQDGDPALPVTGVSFHDAAAYAAWLSQETGRKWRLPSDREWALAAGSRFVDDGFEEADPANPATRWLAEYDAASAKKRAEDSKLRPAGGFGANEHGLLDLAGNVWEWTSTCYLRHSTDPASGEVTRHENCGVRVAEGAHRAYLTGFIRDPKSGACSVGAPPTHLGIRLVREEPGFLGRIGGFLGL
ncbi:SUMF1/EgtB/PvdO family nonheme iron enzyme [Afifella pfennigii]|uniref:SUMF1/EgtB/PvdO family nonheme iron enzyme n=1 Tax=Afifella pfennigii TaxID=209897 RepID=UPI000553CB05|nr:SUMF1/EgtB/PvdO family nonheme iron enzyme [Afifella pfennigii]